MSARESAVAQLDDKTLVKRYWAGDVDAEREFRKRWEQKLHGRAYSILHDAIDTEICVEITMVTAGLKIDEYRGENFRGWILAICENAALEIIRSRRSTVPLPPGLAALQTSPEESASLAEQIVALKECISNLSDEAQLYLELHYFDEFSYSWIAELENVNKRRVQTVIWGARKALLHCMTKAGMK